MKVLRFAGGNRSRQNPKSVPRSNARRSSWRRQLRLESLEARQLMAVIGPEAPHLPLEDADLGHPIDQSEIVLQTINNMEPGTLSMEHAFGKESPRGPAADDVDMDAAAWPDGWETMEIEAKWTASEATLEGIKADFPEQDDRVFAFDGISQNYDISIRWGGLPR